MNIEEKESLIRDVRALVDRHPTSATKESLANTERMIEALPDDFSTLYSATNGVSGGVILRWKLFDDTDCFLSMTVNSRMDGFLFHRPTNTTLAEFEQDAKDSVDVPCDFVGEFVKAREGHADGRKKVTNAWWHSSRVGRQA